MGIYKHFFRTQPHRPRGRNPFEINYFSSAKYLMVRTIWLV